MSEWLSVLGVFMANVGTEGPEFKARGFHLYIITSFLRPHKYYICFLRKQNGPIIITEL